MTKAQIEKRIWELQVIMNLTHWEVGVVYDDPKPFIEYNVKQDCPALVIANSQYLYLELFFNPMKKLEKVNDAVLIHELCHCLTSELKGYVWANKKIDNEWVSYFEERLVSQMERILLKGIK